LDPAIEFVVEVEVAYRYFAPGFKLKRSVTAGDHAIAAVATAAARTTMSDFLIALGYRKRVPAIRCGNF
jgi:hypothetical protein